MVSGAALCRGGVLATAAGGYR